MKFYFLSYSTLRKSSHVASAYSERHDNNFLTVFNATRIIFDPLASLSDPPGIGKSISQGAAAPEVRKPEFYIFFLIDPSWKKNNNLVAN